MIYGCRQAISTLFNAFSIFIAAYFNLHLAKFAKSHYLFEFNRRQTIFFQIKCLELYKWCHAMCRFVSFLRVQLKSKHLRENEKTRKSFNFAKLSTSDSYFENFLSGQSPYALKHVIITFHLPHIFQYIPLKNVANYFCFKKK